MVRPPSLRLRPRESFNCYHDKAGVGALKVKTSRANLARLERCNNSVEAGLRSAKTALLGECASRLCRLAQLQLAKPFSSLRTEAAVACVRLSMGDPPVRRL